MRLDAFGRFDFLGESVALDRPMFVVIAVLVVFLFAWAIWNSVRRDSVVAKWVHPRMLNVLSSGNSSQALRRQGALYAFSLVCFCLALSQPQCAAGTEMSRRQGVDVVIAMDASKSMYAEDVQPSRLSRARLELNTLLDALHGDRVAIVSFAAEAFVQCPLTSDYEAAKMFLRSINPDDMPQGGTNIGAALRTSLDVLQNADKGSKERVVILLSDGEDLDGDVEPSVAKLRAADVRVLVVGIGNEEGAPIPIFDEQGQRAGVKKDRAGNIVLSRLSTETLKAIAEATEGQFFYEPEGVAMNQVVEQINRMQKSELESRVTIRYAEVFQAFLGVGLALISIGMWLGPSKRRPA